MLVTWDMDRRKKINDNFVPKDTRKSLSLGCQMYYTVKGQDQGYTLNPYKSGISETCYVWKMNQLDQLVN